MDRVDACKIGNRKREGGILENFEAWKEELYDREEFRNLAFVVFSVGSKKDRRN